MEKHNGKQAFAHLRLTDDNIELSDASGGAQTVSLPAASKSTGLLVIVKKIDSSANTVTIDPNGSETIDGQSTVVLYDQYEVARCYCNGSAWYLV